MLDMIRPGAKKFSTGMLAFLAISMMMLVASASVGFTESNSMVFYNQYQTLTANAMSGTPPYTFNFLIYNAVGNLVASNIVTPSSALPIVTAGATNGTIATPEVDVSVSTTGGSPTLWICGFGLNQTGSNVWQSQSYFIDNSSFDTYAQVGNQTSNNCDSQTQQPTVLASVGAGITTAIPYVLTIPAAGPDMGGGPTMDLVTSGTSTTIIIITCGGGACDSAGGGSITGIPAGCTHSQHEDQDHGESADLYVCQGLGATSATITASTAGEGAMAAYTFYTSPASQASYTFQMLPAWLTGNYMANVIIKDSASATASNTLHFQVNTDYLPPSLPSAPGATVPTTEPGLYESFSTTFTGSTGTGGGGPYTYTWNIANSTTGAIFYTATYSNALAGNTINVQIPSTFLGHSPFKANVVVSDGISTVNSSYGPTFKVVSPFTAISISPAATQKIDNGQSVAFTATATGGVVISNGYQWRSGAGSCTSGSSPIGGATNSTYSASPSSNTFYCVTGTDTASGNTITSAATEVVVYPALASTSWTKAANPVFTGAIQTLTANIINGVPPYTYNISVFNINTITVQPDVMVLHSSGAVSIYNAQTDTNNARGIALMKALSNAVTGDKIYLKAETYNLSNNSISQSGYDGRQTNIDLYGAGKYKTIIESIYNSTGPGDDVLVHAGVNSITADLSIYNLLGSLVSSPHTAGWGAFTSTFYGNSTLRNVFIKGFYDGVYLNYVGGYAPAYGGPLANVILENDTVNTTYDAFRTNWNTNTIKVFIADSAFTGNYLKGEYSSQTARGVVISGGNVVIVNTIMTAVGGPMINQGLSADTDALVYLYGGKSNSLASGPSNDIYNNGATVYANSTFSYNALRTTGPINTGLLGSTPYGVYLYQKFPTTPPTVGSLVYSTLVPSTSALGSIFSYTQGSRWGAGNFLAQVVVQDSAASPLAVSNALYYLGDAFTSNPSLPATLAPGQSIVFTANVSLGSLPYTFNYILSNTITGSIVASQLYTGVSTTYNSFTWTIPSSALGNSIRANVVVTDGGGDAINSTYLGTLTVATTTTTTTIPNGGGGGSSGGGGGGGGGSGFTESVAYTNTTTSQTGYRILNFTQDGTQRFAIAGKQFNVTLNFIGSDHVGVTINGHNYTLYANQTVEISDPLGYAYYTELTGISYLPIVHSVNMEVFAMSFGSQNVTTITSTTTPTTTSSTSLYSNITTTVSVSVITQNQSTTTITAVPVSTKTSTPSLYSVIFTLIIIVLVVITIELHKRRIPTKDKIGKMPPKTRKGSASKTMAKESQIAEVKLNELRCANCNHRLVRLIPSLEILHGTPEEPTVLCLEEECDCRTPKILKGQFVPAKASSKDTVTKSRKRANKKRK